MYVRHFCTLLKFHHQPSKSLPPKGSKRGPLRWVIPPKPTSGLVLDFPKTDIGWNLIFRGGWLFGFSVSHGFSHCFHKNSRSNFSVCWGPITMRLRDGLMASWIFWTKAQHWRARWIFEPSLRASQLEYLKSIQYFQAMEFPEWMVFSVFF